MKANELRIGNLIRYTNDEDLNTSLRGTPLVVDIDTLTYIEIGDRPDFYEPIPVTIKILIKCGFVKRRDREYLYSIDLHKHISIVDGKDRFLAMLLQDAEFSGGELSVFCCNEIKYLHQLQNLIFSISGEELEVKL